MDHKSFWSGFACGAGAVIGGGLIAGRLRRGGASRILRLEKSIQIARPVHDVWETWGDLDSLPAMSDSISRVRSFGDRSRWTVNLKGVPVEWEAEITQIIPYQAMGWKSVSGPKHSGRVTFSPLGNDTLVHVQMNYAPPSRWLRRALSPFSGELEGYIEEVLRDFKAALEKQRGQGQSGQPNATRATGTHGSGPELLSQTR